MFKQIIINTPTSIGDSVLALPVIDRLKANYPEADITVICSKYNIEYLSRHSFVAQTLLFDKRWRMSQKIKFAFSLRKKYDLVVDLKNSALPLIIGAKHTSFFRNFKQNSHAKDNYLKIIEKIAPLKNAPKAEIRISEEEKEKWCKFGLSPSLFVACASNALQKRYPYNYLKQALEELKNHYRLVILGQESERQFYQDILSLEGVIDLVGETKIYEIFYLLKNYAKLLLCVDSSILHIASYVNAPAVALFGQNNPQKYGPWSDKFSVITNKNLACVPCGKPHCDFDHRCMEIEPSIVVEAVKQLSVDI
jgi:heptosyltransferase-2